MGLNERRSTMNKQEAIERMARAAFVEPISANRMADMEAALNALIEYLPDYTDLKYGSRMLEHERAEFGSYLLYKQLKGWKDNG